MRRFFGKKQAEKPSAPGPSLGDVGGKMDSRTQALEAKIHKLEKDILECKKKMQKARGAAKQTHKRRALKLLKQKKQYEQQLDRVYGQQMNIDSARFATESMQDNADMVAAMKVTATTLKEQYKTMDIDAVEDMQDEMMDLMEDANEINEIMGQAWGMDDIDDDDLLEELDGLEDDLDLEMDTDDVPDYMKSAAKDTDKAEADASVDQYGLPKVPAEKMYN